MAFFCGVLFLVNYGGDVCGLTELLLLPLRSRRSKQEEDRTGLDCERPGGVFILCVFSA